MNQVFPPDWRTHNRWKRRFYATYMKNLERIGYLVVASVFVAFIFAFNFKVDDVLKADSVDVRPVTIPIVCSDSCIVVESLSPNFSDVSIGAKVLRIVQGERNIALYRARTALTGLRKLGATASAGAMTIPDPEVITIASPASGVFRYQTAHEFEAGETIAEVLNYDELEIKASFEGQTVSKAKVSDRVSISNLVVGNVNGELLRGSSPAGQIISTSLLGAEVKTLLNTRLRNLAVNLRNDLPMRIQEVKSVMVDTEVIAAEASSSDRAVRTEPSESYKVVGSVISGTHVCELQLTSLPIEILDEAQKKVTQRLNGAQVATPLSRSIAIQGLKNVTISVQVAAQAGDSTGPLVEGIPTQRKYEATVRVTKPPNYLIQLLKSADREGRTVKARAELITGSRPIALNLLKKS